VQAVPSMQAENARLPIDITSLEILSEFRELHIANAKIPIDITSLEILNELRELQ
jgi:hypothetical protein